MKGRHDAAVVNTVAVWSLNNLPVSVWFFSGGSGFHPQPKDMLVRLTSSKLFVYVNEIIKPTIIIMISKLLKRENHNFEILHY